MQTRSYPVRVRARAPFFSRRLGRAVMHLSCKQAHLGATPGAGSTFMEVRPDKRAGTVSNTDRPPEVVGGQDLGLPLFSQQELFKCSRMSRLRNRPVAKPVERLVLPREVDGATPSGATILAVRVNNHAPPPHSFSAGSSKAEQSPDKRPTVARYHPGGPFFKKLP